MLYTASPPRKVIALDAATGRELWKWNPHSERPGGGAARQRGLVFWQNETGGEQRLFTGVGNHLYALDPKDGHQALALRQAPAASPPAEGTKPQLTGNASLNPPSPRDALRGTDGRIYRDLKYFAPIQIEVQQ